MADKMLAGLTAEKLAEVVAAMVAAYEAHVERTGDDPLARFIETDGERLGLKLAA